MDYLKTTSCCGCINLRTAGLIIGFLSLVGCLLFPIFGWPWEFVWLVMYAAWLYGIFKHQSKWLMPALCYNILRLFIVGLGIILVPIAGFIFANDIQKYIDDIAQKRNMQVVPTVTAFMAVLWVSVTILTALQYHISAVMCSLYKEVKEEERLQNSI